ncbi:MAG: hypothetical protein JSS30_01660 [Verrucomicrobia bacterium]|nr:hypothetical protein [Verrucomicrobiota bacterium]
MKIVSLISCAALLLAENLTAGSISESLLPNGLVLKPSTGNSFPYDSDFHITLHDPNTAVIWVAETGRTNGEYLCGAVCALDDPDCNIQSIMKSNCKMITRWTSSPRKGDYSPLSSIPHREIDWDQVSSENQNDKWQIAGVHKKLNVPVNYLIKKGDKSQWISKEEALELSLEGKLEVIVP